MLFSQGRYYSMKETDLRELKIDLYTEVDTYICSYLY